MSQVPLLATQWALTTNDEQQLELLHCVDEAATDSDHHRVGSIVGVELAHNALHARLDRVFGDEERIGDIAIAAALGDQLKDARLSLRQRLLTNVAGNLLCHVWSDSVPTGERTTDGADDLLAAGCLEEI